MRYGRMFLTALLGALLMVTAAVPAATGSPAKQVLMAQTDGVIWSYDIDTGQVSQFASITPGDNYAMQFLNPGALLIGNGDALFQLNLRSLDESLVTQRNELGVIVGLAVSRRAGGTYYIDDLPSGVFAYDPRTGQLEQLLAVAQEIEGMAIDKKGILYLSRGPLVQRIDPSQDPLEVETVAEIPDTFLTGMVVAQNGELYVISTPGTFPETITPGVYRVDVRSGEVTAIHEGSPLDQPGAPAIDRNGDLYFMDDATGSGEGQRLFRIRPGSSELELLHTGAPLGDLPEGPSVAAMLLSN